MHKEDRVMVWLKGFMVGLFTSGILSLIYHTITWLQQSTELIQRIS